MSNDNNQDQSKPSESNSVDLSSLENIQFQTAWTPSSSSEDGKFLKRSFEPRRKPFGGGKPRREDSGDAEFQRRDRPRGEFKDSRRKRFDRDGGRKSGEGAPSGKRFSDGGRFHKKGRDGKFDKKGFVPFKFTMDVLFYPEDAAFAKLSSLMKRLKRTYQLFDIANLILEKPERFIVVAKNLPDADGKIAPLYCAQPLNLPFETQEEARKSALDYYVSEMFVKETIDVEPPKGNFQVVNICTLGGELLGAPNWHRYGEFLKEFHAEKYPNVPYDKFLASIESSRDADKISEWLESMKKREVYKLKEIPEGESGDSSVFETREAASNYVALKYADNLVKVYETVRMKGANISLLPHGRIRRNMEEMLRNQRRFPIVTANNLRGRLRRSGFAIYKRGSKSYAFVSAVKRKFLFEGESFAERPQKIFDFITANPGISSFALPYMFLGLEAPELKQKAKTLAEEHNSLSKDVQAQPEEQIQETKDNSSDQGAPTEAKAEVEASEMKDESANGESIQKQNVEEASGKESEIKPAANPKYTPEQLEKLSEVSRELLWLVSEGYVVEYADATLQANPYMPKPKASQKAVKASEEGENAAVQIPVEKDEPVLKEDVLSAAETDIPSDEEASVETPKEENKSADLPDADSYGAECNLKECLPGNGGHEQDSSAADQKQE